MARFRRSKTNTTYFMDIPKSNENKRFKEQEIDKEKEEELLTPWR